MKFFYKVILILGIAWIAQVFLPFWIVAIAAFLVGFTLSERPHRRIGYGRKQKQSYSFLAGFLPAFFLWLIIAWIGQLQSEHLIGQKISHLIFQDQFNPTVGNYLLMLISALIGGLLGGLGCMTGNFFGQAIKAPKY